MHLFVIGENNSWFWIMSLDVAFMANIYMIAVTKQMSGATKTGILVK